MSRLFNRRYKLVLDEIEIEGGGVGEQRFGLDISFKIEMSIKPDPNKATIRVLNLNPDHLDGLQKRSGSELKKGKRQPVTVELTAGYEDDAGIIFAGDLRNLRNLYDGVDYTTEVSGGDGGHSYKAAEVSRNFAPGTRVADVMRACVAALGVGDGNLGEFASRLSIKNLGATYPEGTVLHGAASSALDRVVKSCGLEWSIQKGVLQLKERGKPIDRDVFFISSDTGLVGTPTAEVDATVLPSASGKAPAPEKSKSGSVKLQTLLLHQLYPGAKIELDSLGFKGSYQITELVQTGDTASTEWYSDLIVRPY